MSWYAVPLLEPAAISTYLFSGRPVFIALFLYAFALGTLFPRLGDLQLEMGLSESVLGLSLIGLPLGVQLSLLVANRIISYLALAQIMIFGLIMIVCSYTAATLVSEPSLFFQTLLMAGLSVGPLEVAVNLEPDRVEYGLEQRIINRSHAFWSLGFFATGLSGALMAQLGVLVVFHFAGIGLIIVALTIFCFLGFTQAPLRPSADTSTPRFVRPSAAILVLVGLTLSAMLAEGSAIEWSVIYMSDIFATVPFFSGLALTLKAPFQFITRYFADHFVVQYGPYKVAKICLWIMLAGVILVAIVPTWPPALAGFACLGGRVFYYFSASHVSCCSA